MPSYNKQSLAEKAKELSVVRDTLEKVMRLIDILAFFAARQSILSFSICLVFPWTLTLIFATMFQEKKCWLSERKSVN